MKTFFTTAMLAIFAVLLLTAIFDQGSKTTRTFTVTSKYSKLECVPLLCITKNTNYYFVTGDGKLYHTDNEEIYDQLDIARPHTALIVPRNGYITEVVDPGFKAPSLQEAWYSLFPMKEWNLGRYKVMWPASSPAVVALFVSSLCFAAVRLRRLG